MEQDYYYTHATITNQQCTLNLHHLLFSLSCVSWCSGCLCITLSLYESFYADHRIMRLHGFDKLFIVYYLHRSHLRSLSWMWTMDFEILLESKHQGCASNKFIP
ncbi:hypothetical protein PHET_03064 [Paragonimus heterotremus]|uniref:Uncharacterized protein n=1 Tax=Paragonimus heterotremus TaxID=100268 RepID=A0A8J4T148_9TREM|nr:hypothetical protein PHET_03064 [Paragonimus heterotremus]